MDRLRSFSSASTNEMQASEGSSADAALSRPFDYSIDYTCNSILFPMPDFVRQIGLPIDVATAAEILDKVELFHALLDEEAASLLVSSVTNLGTYKSHAVACLNELKSMMTAKAYLGHGNLQVYAVLLLERGHMTPPIFTNLSTINDVKAGTAVLRALQFGEAFDTATFGPELTTVVSTLQMLGYKDKALLPLIFAVGKINTEYYADEAVSVSSFLGIAEDKLPYVKAHLAGKEYHPPVPSVKEKEPEEGGDGGAKKSKTPMDVPGTPVDGDDALHVFEKAVSAEKKVDFHLEEQTGSQTALLYDQTSLERENPASIEPVTREESEHEEEVEPKMRPRRSSGTSASKRKAHPPPPIQEPVAQPSKTKSRANVRRTPTRSSKRPRSSRNV